MQNTEPTLWQRRWSVFRWYLSQFSTVLHVILHTPFAAVAATALKNLVRFDRVFQKLLMWCTETTLFPRRQSAENAGRHWNSTEEVPSPHRTCVTEQLELTRQVARIERVIINTTSTHPRVKVSIVGSLRDREVACSASDRQGSNFESCVWRTVSSQSSHHPQEVLLAQFSLYVHKGGLKPDSFHFYYIDIGPISFFFFFFFLRYDT